MQMTTVSVMAGPAGSQGCPRRRSGYLPPLHR